MYNIPENMYYYIKLWSPIRFAVSTVSSYYNLALRCYIDLGDYYCYSDMSFTLGTNSYITMTYFKRYLEKSQFPEHILLAGFEQIKVKFAAKEEDSYVLQFDRSIFSVSTLTYGLNQLADSVFKLGEILHISYDGVHTWKKGSKSLIFKPPPVNFADVTYGKSLYESQDYLKSVKLVWNSPDSQYYIYVCDEARYIK